MAGLSPLQRPGVLVPVPLGKGRRRRRGYNQAERLARGLAGASLPCRPDLLERSRETASQTRLPPEARLANVAGAFRAAGAAGLRVVLVDDVFTTGATLVAAAAALVEAGARTVEAVTFARAMPPLA
jgi:ComF family protein